jgi:hypothetical protein
MVRGRPTAAFGGQLPAIVERVTSAIDQKRDLIVTDIPRVTV